MANVVEIVESIDETTLEMIEAVKTENILELKKLFELRKKQIKILKTLSEKIPEAALSKLSSDSQTLDKLFEKLMKKTKGKVEEISRNIENIQKYATVRESSHINERR